MPVSKDTATWAVFLKVYLPFSPLCQTPTTSKRNEATTAAQPSVSVFALEPEHVAGQHARRCDCRSDRRGAGAAAGRGLCRDRRHAARVRTLHQHGTGGDRRAVRIVLAPGFGPDHRGLGNHVRIAERAGDPGQPGVRAARDHARLHGRRAAAGDGPGATRRTGQLHFSFGRGRLHRRGRLPDRGQAGRGVSRHRHSGRQPSAAKLRICMAALATTASVGHGGRRDRPAHRHPDPATPGRHEHDRRAVRRRARGRIVQHHFRRGDYRHRNDRSPAAAAAAAVDAAVFARSPARTLAAGPDHDPVRADRSGFDRALDLDPVRPAAGRQPGIHRPGPFRLMSPPARSTAAGPTTTPARARRSRRFLPR